jgi:hypothetical protein
MNSPAKNYIPLLWVKREIARRDGINLVRLIQHCRDSRGSDGQCPECTQAALSLPLPAEIKLLARFMLFNVQQIKALLNS